MAAADDRLTAGGERHALRVVWIVLAILTAIAVVAGAWFYLREEYAFTEVGDGDVVTLYYQGPAGGGQVFGSVQDPPPELAGWIRSWERDTSGESTPTDVVVTIVLRDGRRIRVDVGDQRGYASWIDVGAVSGKSVAVHFNKDFLWYVHGLGDGLMAAPAPHQPSPSPSASSTVLSQSPSP